jgi:hypothetical protein
MEHISNKEKELLDDASMVVHRTDLLVEFFKLNGIAPLDGSIAMLCLILRLARSKKENADFLKKLVATVLESMENEIPGESKGE